MVERIRGACRASQSGCRTHAPIVGAALLALDQVGAGAEAQARVRRELPEQVADG